MTLDALTQKIELTASRATLLTPMVIAVPAAAFASGPIIGSVAHANANGNLLAAVVVIGWTYLAGP